VEKVFIFLARNSEGNGPLALFDADPMFVEKRPEQGLNRTWRYSEFSRREGSFLKGGSKRRPFSAFTLSRITSPAGGMEALASRM